MRVWLATGTTDMRRGMNSLALRVQQGLQRDPHAGDFYVFRGKLNDLLKILWHDGLGMSLYAKRSERCRFIWPTPVSGARQSLLRNSVYAGGGSPAPSVTNRASGASQLKAT